MFSCSNNSNSMFEGIIGNGNVVSNNRKITESFDTIESKTGITVILEQAPIHEVIVKTDENLQSILKTEVKQGVLEIYFDKNNISSDEKTVYVKMPNISKIRASSGSLVESSTSLKAENLELKTSSGSEMELKLNVKNLNCESSSGSEINATGKAQNVVTNSSSGSTINLKDLEMKMASCKSSSGSSTKINPSEILNADVSSGASIKYYSNPRQVTVDESSGGSVSNKSINISQ